MTNYKTVACQIIFMIVAVVGFVIAKVGLDAAFEGDPILFTIGLGMMFAGLVVNVAIVVVPAAQAIKHRYDDKEPENDNDDEGLNLK